MREPAWYEPDYFMEADHEYIHINDHNMILSEIENDVEQLIDELYDECETVDRDVIHQLLLDITEKLDMKKPNKQTLKL